MLTCEADRPLIGRTNVLLDAATGSVYDVLLALLNVVQTVALAYLAADRHTVTRARMSGLSTRRDDPPKV
jgi:hypothetical protein